MITLNDLGINSTTPVVSPVKRGPVGTLNMPYMSGVSCNPHFQPISWAPN